MSNFICAAQRFGQRAFVVKGLCFPDDILYFLHVGSTMTLIISHDSACSTRLSVMLTSESLSETLVSSIVGKTREQHSVTSWSSISILPYIIEGHTR